MIRTCEPMLPTSKAERINSWLLRRKEHPTRKRLSFDGARCALFSARTTAAGESNSALVVALSGAVLARAFAVCVGSRTLERCADDALVRARSGNSVDARCGDDPGAAAGNSEIGIRCADRSSSSTSSRATSDCMQSGSAPLTVHRLRRSASSNLPAGIVALCPDWAIRTGRRPKWSRHGRGTAECFRAAARILDGSPQTGACPRYEFRRSPQRGDAALSVLFLPRVGGLCRADHRRHRPAFLARLGQRFARLAARRGIVRRTARSRRRNCGPSRATSVSCCANWSTCIGPPTRTSSAGRKETLRATLRGELRGNDIIVVSNREPYVHDADGGTIHVQRPASGLVTALEPVMRACSGTWIAHGSGSADRETVDQQ